MLGLLARFSLQRGSMSTPVLGVLTADELQQCWSPLITLVWALPCPVFHPFLGQPMFEDFSVRIKKPHLSCLDLRLLRRTIPASEFPVGSAKAYGTSASHFNFSCCLVLFPLVLHGSLFWEYSPVDSLHAKLHLRVYFLGN